MNSIHEFIIYNISIKYTNNDSHLGRFVLIFSASQIGLANTLNHIRIDNNVIIDDGWMNGDWKANVELYKFINPQEGQGGKKDGMASMT